MTPSTGKHNMYRTTVYVIGSTKVLTHLVSDLDTSRAWARWYASLGHVVVRNWA